MAAGPQLNLGDILDNAGVPKEAQTYLTARGVTLPSTLAMLAPDADALQVKLIDRFIAGRDIQGTIHKNTSDPDVVAATLTVAWQLCRQQVCQRWQPCQRYRWPSPVYQQL